MKLSWMAFCTMSCTGGAALRRCVGLAPASLYAASSKDRPGRTAGAAALFAAGMLRHGARGWGGPKGASVGDTHTQDMPSTYANRTSTTDALARHANHTSTTDAYTGPALHPKPMPIVQARLMHTQDLPSQDMPITRACAEPFPLRRPPKTHSFPAVDSPLPRPPRRPYKNAYNNAYDNAYNLPWKLFACSA